MMPSLPVWGCVVDVLHATSPGSAPAVRWTARRKKLDLSAEQYPLSYLENKQLRHRNRRVRDFTSQHNLKTRAGERRPDHLAGESVVAQHPTSSSSN